MVISVSPTISAPDYYYYPFLRVMLESCQAPEPRTDTIQEHFVGSAETASRIQNTFLLIDFFFYQLGHRVAYRKQWTKGARLNSRKLDHRPNFWIMKTCRGNHVTRARVDMRLIPNWMYECFTCSSEAAMGAVKSSEASTAAPQTCCIWKTKLRLRCFHSWMFVKQREAGSFGALARLWNDMDQCQLVAGTRLGGTIM